MDRERQELEQHRNEHQRTSKEEAQQRRQSVRNIGKVLKDDSLVSRNGQKWKLTVARRAQGSALTAYLVARPLNSLFAGSQPSTGSGLSCFSGWGQQMCPVRWHSFHTAHSEPGLLPRLFSFLKTARRFCFSLGSKSRIRLWTENIPVLA